VDDDWLMVDWMSRTGTSDIRANWLVPPPIQSLAIWTPDGEIDLGEEYVAMYPQEQVWRSLKTNNPTLQAKSRYQMYDGTHQIQWTDIPVPKVTVVPFDIPTQDRGEGVEIAQLLE
jgi:hypothetical protein